MRWVRSSRARSRSEEWPLPLMIRCRPGDGVIFGSPGREALDGDVENFVGGLIFEFDANFASRVMLS